MSLNREPPNFVSPEPAEIDAPPVPATRRPHFLENGPILRNISDGSFAKSINYHRYIWYGWYLVVTIRETEFTIRETLWGVIIRGPQSYGQIVRMVRMVTCNHDP